MKQYDCTLSKYYIKLSKRKTYTVNLIQNLHFNFQINANGLLFLVRVKDISSSGSTFKDCKSALRALKLF